MNLYCQYVRPHLEFSTPAWSPWLVADIEVLERAQKKAVGMVWGLKGKTYAEKCDELNIDQLTIRRQIADLVQVYKYVHSNNQDAANELFERVTERNIQTRQSSDPLNFKPVRARLEVRKYSFASRVVQHWNSLSPETKRIGTVHQFKQALKNIYRRPVGGVAAELHEIG